MVFEYFQRLITPTLTLPSPRRRLYEPEAVEGEGIHGINEWAPVNPDCTVDVIPLLAGRNPVLSGT